MQPGQYVNCSAAEPKSFANLPSRTSLVRQSYTKKHQQFMELSGWQAHSCSCKVFNTFDQGAHGGRILHPRGDGTVNSKTSPVSLVVLAVWLGGVCNHCGLMNESIHPDYTLYWSSIPDLAWGEAVTLSFAGQSYFKQLTQHLSNYVPMWEKS